MAATPRAEIARGLIPDRPAVRRFPQDCRRYGERPTSRGFSYPADPLGRCRRAADAKTIYCGTRQVGRRWSVIRTLRLDRCRGRDRSVRSPRYVKDVTERAAGRERPDPSARNQDFVNACEEAIVKLAFSRAGTPVDYISVQSCAAGTRTLGSAIFPTMSRPPTAPAVADRDLILEGGGNVHAAPAQPGATGHPKALHGIDRRAASSRRSLWVPIIYRVRAAVCSHLPSRTASSIRAVPRVAPRRTGADLPFRINLDRPSYGSVPPLEPPLVVNTRNGTTESRSLCLVPIGRHPHAPERKLP